MTGFPGGGATGPRGDGSGVFDEIRRQIEEAMGLREPRQPASRKQAPLPQITRHRPARDGQFGLAVGSMTAYYMLIAAAAKHRRRKLRAAREQQAQQPDGTSQDPQA